MRIDIGSAQFSEVTGLEGSQFRFRDAQPADGRQLRARLGGLGTWQWFPNVQILMYPPVNKHSYEKWPFIVDFPVENGDFPWLCSFTRGYMLI